MKKFKNNLRVKSDNFRLLEAFEDELREVGYQRIGKNHEHKYDIIGIYDYGQYQYFNHLMCSKKDKETIQLTLPEDWYKALELAKETKKKLFTTEDGVDIYEDEEYYWINTHDSFKGSEYGYFSINAPSYVADLKDPFMKGVKTFSTKQAAQEYIDKNKPNEEFKVGDWVITDLNSIAKIKKIDTQNGCIDTFYYRNEDTNIFYEDARDPFIYSNIARKATTEEIKNELIRQANERYKVGDKVEKILEYNSGNISHYPTDPYRIYNMKDWMYKEDEDWLYENNLCVYNKGQWAEIIEEEKYIKVIRSGGNHTSHPEYKKIATGGEKLKVIKKEPYECVCGDFVYVCEGDYVIYSNYAVEISKEEFQPQAPQIEINGYKAVFFPKYVKFGCAEIDPSLFKLLAQVNYKIEYGNKSVEEVKIGAGTFTMDQIKQIADYYASKR